MRKSWNKIKSKTAFSKWIGSVSEEERRKHFIPNGIAGIEDFEEFLQKRKKLIEANFNY